VLLRSPPRIMCGIYVGQTSDRLYIGEVVQQSNTDLGDHKSGQLIEVARGIRTFAQPGPRRGGPIRRAALHVLAILARMWRQLLLVFAVVAVAILLSGQARALQASLGLGGRAAADAAIPCSKASVPKIVHLTWRYQSLSVVRCADLNNDGRRDVAWLKSGGGRTLSRRL
jgi:hypothetical protein